MFFTIWVMFWNIGRIYFFLFSIQNIKSNCSIILLKLFRIIFFCWKFIPSQIWLFIKDLIFVILLEYFSTSSWFNATVKAYWKYLFFLLARFIVVFLLFSNQKNLFMIHHNQDLFYDIYNKLNEHNRIETTYLPLILANCFNIY